MEWYWNAESTKEKEMAPNEISKTSANFKQNKDQG